MRRNVVSRERLFSSLRQSGLLHLGQAKRVYLEADGHFSVFQNPDPPAGMCLMPQADLELFEKQFHVDDAFACRSCGHVLYEQSRRPGPCPRCTQEQWSPAVQTTEVGELKPASELDE